MTEVETAAATVIEVQAAKKREENDKKKTEFPSTQPARHKKSMKHDNSAKKTIKEKKNSAKQPTAKQLSKSKIRSKGESRAE